MEKEKMEKEKDEKIENLENECKNLKRENTLNKLLG